MTKLDSLIDQLAEAVKTLPEVKQFFALREQILGDPFLNECQEKMKHHQKLMMKVLTDQVVYQEHQQAFDQHPLVQNYQTLKEQLSPLLNELQAIIE